MLGRRRVLTGMLGVGAVGLGGMPAGAQSAAQVAGVGERQHAAVAEKIWRDKCSFADEARAILADDIARGAAPAGSERTVVCPLCRDSITLTG